MPDQTIEIKITGESSGLNSAMQNSAGAVQGFVGAAAQVPPVIDAANASSQAFSESLNQLKESINGFSGGIGDIVSHLDKAAEAFTKTKKPAEELKNSVDLLGHRVELRELSSSIREGIENPLGAAKNAAQALVLSLGPVGLAGTAFLAIAGVAVEASLHVGELAEEYEKLSGILGIGIEPAEHLARTFNLMGLEQGALIMANRTFSRVMDEGSVIARALRDELDRMGVTLRDANSGAIRPFNELLPEIIDHLKEMENVSERNRIATELFGRSALQLLGLDWDKYSNAAKGGISADDLKTAKEYGFAWKEIKEQLGDAYNAFGLWSEKAIVTAHQLPTAFAAARDILLSLTGDAKSAPIASFPVPKAAPPGVEAYAKSLTLEGKKAEIASTNRAIAEALKGVGGEAEVAEKHLATLQAELGKFDNVPKSTPTAIAGVNVGQLIAQVEAEKNHIQSLKAEGEALKIREQTITGAEKYGVAEVALSRKVFEDQIKLAQIGQAELVKLAGDTNQARYQAEVGFVNQELALETDRINKLIALQQTEKNRASTPEKKAQAEAAIGGLQNERVAAEQKAAASIEGIDARMAESRAKYAEAQIKQAQELSAIQEEGAAMAQEFADKITNDQRTHIEAVSKAAEDAQFKQQKDILETQKTQLESDERVRLKELTDAGAGYRARIAVVQKYGEEIAAVIAKLNDLSIKEGTAKDARENKNTINEISRKQGVSTETAGQLAAPEFTSAGQQTAEAAASKTTVDNATALTQKLAELKKEQDKADFTNYFGKMNTGLQTALTGWISGTQTFSKAFTNLGQQMVTGWISSLAMMGVKWVEHHLLLRAVQEAWNAASIALHISKSAATNAADAAGAAAAAPIRVGEVTGAAAVGAANAMAATAIIPFVGPELAPAAGAAMFAAIMGYSGVAAFEKGGIVGGSSQLALLHPHEMVLPQNVSKSVQSMASGGGGNSSGGDTHNYNGDVHYHAAPGENETSIMKNKAMLNKMVQQMMRGGKLKPI